MKRKPSTIKDIAQGLNLNISTVSRALNNNKNISEETRKLVHKYAEKLHYKPNAIASSLRMGRGNTIGMVVPNINRHFFSNLIFGVEMVLNKAGYNILICQSNESLEKEKQAISTLIKSRVDGIIISISMETSNFKHLEAVINNDIPLVQTDRVANSLSTNKIINSNINGAFYAVNHLIERGYKRIAHFSGPLEINIYHDRFSGYLKSLEQARIEFDKNLVFTNVLTDVKSFELTNKLIKDKNLPDAFFAASDFAALGVLKALKENNIKIPEEIGIVGFANEPFTELVSPPLTSLNQFSIEMGKEAARVMLDELSNNDENRIPKQITIDPQLIIRESSNRKILILG